MVKDATIKRFIAGDNRVMVVAQQGWQMVGMKGYSAKIEHIEFDHVIIETQGNIYFFEKAGQFQGMTEIVEPTIWLGDPVDDYDTQVQCDEVINWQTPEYEEEQ